MSSMLDRNSNEYFMVCEECGIPHDGPDYYGDHHSRIPDFMRQEVPVNIALSIPARLFDMLVLNEGERADALRKGVRRVVRNIVTMHAGSRTAIATELSRYLCSLTTRVNTVVTNANQQHNFRAFFVVSSMPLTHAHFQVALGTVAITRMRGGACQQTIKHYHYVFTTDHFVPLTAIHVNDGLANRVSITGVVTSTIECVRYIRTQLMPRAGITDGGVVHRGVDWMDWSICPAHAHDEYYSNNVRRYGADAVNDSVERPLGRYETHVDRAMLGMNNALTLRFGAERMNPRASVWTLRNGQVLDMGSETYTGQYYIQIPRELWNGDEGTVIHNLSGREVYSRARCFVLLGCDTGRLDDDPGNVGNANDPLLSVTQSSDDGH